MGIRGSKLRVSFGDKTILHGIDFRAETGSLVGILGPSGSGKSTLLMALSGFRPAHEGVVHVDNQSLYEKFDTLREDIGFVPQDDIIPASLKVERVLAYAAELRLPDLPAEERTARVEEVIRKLNLTERRKLRVDKLSGGQRKRVNVGVELLAEPAYLFADEPTSGLDPALERSLTETFRTLADDGATVVVTTHVMSSLNLYDALCVIVAGRLAYLGPPSKIKEYFAVDDFTEVYERLDSHPPETWAKRWKKKNSS